MRTQTILSAAVIALIGLTANASAAEFRDFTRAGYDAAIAQNRPVLVDVHAWWCPTCISQGYTLKALAEDPKTKALIIYEVSYDNQKAEWEKFGVTSRGTLIGFHNGKETGRIVYQTDKTLITALVGDTVK